MQKSSNQDVWFFSDWAHRHHPLRWEQALQSDLPLILLTLLLTSLGGILRPLIILDMKSYYKTWSCRLYSVKHFYLKITSSTGCETLPASSTGWKVCICTNNCHALLLKMCHFRVPSDIFSMDIILNICVVCDKYQVWQQKSICQEQRLANDLPPKYEDIIINQAEERKLDHQVISSDSN